MLAKSVLSLVFVCFDVSDLAAGTGTVQALHEPIIGQWQQPAASRCAPAFAPVAHSSRLLLEPLAEPWLVDGAKLTTTSKRCRQSRQADMGCMSLANPGGMSRLSPEGL